LIKSADSPLCWRTYPVAWWWLTEQLRHPAQVLCRGCQQELIGVGNKNIEVDALPHLMKLK